MKKHYSDSTGISSSAYHVDKPLKNMKNTCSNTPGGIVSLSWSEEKLFIPGEDKFRKQRKKNNTKKKKRKKAKNGR